MRPSIAAALSTLGEVFDAEDVLIRPIDASLFNMINGPCAGEHRVIVRPDGSLLLMLEFDVNCPDTQFAFVGALPAASWTWADPKKSPRGEIYLFAEHLDRLAAGETFSIGGVTVSAGPGAQDRLKPAPLARRFCTIEVPLGVFVAGETSDLSGSIWIGSTPAPSPKRTPKDGDRLDSFTVAELDALPVGARFVGVNGNTSQIVKSPHGWASPWSCRTAADVKSLNDGSRTLVLPKPVEAPKPAPSPRVGDRLRDLTPEQRANLPIGTVLEAPDGSPVRTKSERGWEGGCGPVCTDSLDASRTIASLPVSK